MKDRGEQQAQTERPEVLSEHEEAQIAQRVCRVSVLGGTQNLSAYGSWQLNLHGSAWSRALDQMTLWRSLPNSTAW